MDGTLAGVITGGVVSLIVALGAPALAARRARREKRDADQAPVKLAPPTWEQMDARFQEQEKVIRALADVFRDIADQWVGDHPPRINAQSLRVLSAGNYLPPGWAPSEPSKAS